MGDIERHRDVIEELKWKTSVNAAHIGVTVKNDVVTPTGHVPSYAKKFAAERAANRVSGVRAVANALAIKLPVSHRRTDEDIAIAAANAPKSIDAVPADEIELRAGNGWVNLESEVEWNYQKIAAETAIRNLSGVTDVTNSIGVKPSASPIELKAGIEEAPRRRTGRPPHRS